MVDGWWEFKALLNKLKWRKLCQKWRVKDEVSEVKNEENLSKKTFTYIFNRLI